MKYKNIVKQAKKCIENVKTKQELRMSTKWSYYQAKAILNPKTDIPKIRIAKPNKTKQSKISRQISKTDYLELAERYIKYIEKHNCLPGYIKYNGFKLKPRHLTVLFSKIVLYQYKHGELPKEVNFNWKWFIKPTETGNEVYDYFCKVTGKKFTTLDDLLEYIEEYGRYIKYFDDVRSNTQVTTCLCGNCTDWMQWLWNMAKAMGYEVRCLHVQCRVSGTGHVRGQFKHPKNTGGKWIDRDPAAVADGGGITSLWCSDGYLLATNPSWFLENLSR